ncbi:Nmad5 family putative nucleotide modification protein [Bradyrhizobium sp. 613_E4_N2_2]|uniref:Nmad5 family putative nucleotide modification protein n=1 Tax=Bradyrhizobium sp. 613_E4_N2_2 TaxID=3240371 RepID=UPI003F8960D0
MKLNAAHRASIVEKAIKHAFDKREKAHEKERMKFADDLYTHHHGDAEKIAAKLPAGWVEYSNTLIIDHPQFTWPERVNFDTYARMGMVMSKARPWPDSAVSIKVNPGHPFHDRATDLARAEVALKAERRALRIKLNTVVNNANTLKQLAEQWPAGVKFFPAETKPESRALVPASLISDINTTLGLTV